MYVDLFQLERFSMFFLCIWDFIFVFAIFPQIFGKFVIFHSVDVVAEGLNLFLPDEIFDLIRLI